jgi:L-lactate dehydrogenase complex protein LldG
VPEPRRNQEARREIFAAIRGQLAASVPFDAAHEARRVHHQPHFVAAIPAIPALSVLDHFQRSLESVGGQCVRVQSEADAAIAIHHIIDSISARRIAVSDSPLIGRLIHGGSTEFEILRAATQAEMFECDLGITSAQWAIAETGTLVLESDQERHRLASLVPPVHIAVVEAGCIRRTLGEVLRSIDAKGTELSRAITFITGPSRTSDIELTLAIGVHGPAELYVIVIEGGAA